MFGVIASSSGCKGPSHSSSNNKSKNHQGNHDNHQRRGSQDIKDRETFITPEELFQIIANKRHAERLNHRHKHSPRCSFHSDSSFFTSQEKSSHHKDKESSAKKYGVFSINQAIGTSLSCVGGSPQFVRELGIKATAVPKT